MESMCLVFIQVACKQPRVDLPMVSCSSWHRWYDADGADACIIATCSFGAMGDSAYEVR